MTIEVGDMPVRALSELAQSKTAYKLWVSRGAVRMAVDGFPRGLLK